MRVELPDRPYAQKGSAIHARREKVRNSSGWEGLAQAFNAGDFGGGYNMGGIFGGAFGGFREPISQPGTLINNLAAAPVTMQYMALGYAYLTYGVLQTLIDVPVDDAFKGGIVFKVPEFSDDDLKRFRRRWRKMRATEAIKQGFKWGRLFGGGGLIVVTDQDPETPLDVEAIKEGTPLTFLPFDRWEVTVPRVEQNGYVIPSSYLYYGERLDWSRVIRVKGREAPSRIRNLLQGWGMSEVERCLRDIQSFYKLQTVIYGLIDEAKTDVIKAEGINDLLGTAQGVYSVLMRIMFANSIKGNSNALVLDKQDEFDQRTNTFAGLADLMNEARINLAGATRMPVNKLFGLSATGFASGEDAMENYNQLIESDIREPAGPLVDDVAALVFQAEFGYVPDFETAFKPLRVLGPVEEEQVKTSKQNRAAQLRTMDQITGKEMDEILHKEELLDIDTEVGEGLREPAPLGADEGSEDGAKKGAESGDKKEKERNARELAARFEEEARRGSFRRWFKEAA